MLKRCAAIPVSTSKARAQFGGLSGSPFGSGAVQSRGFFFEKKPGISSRVHPLFGSRNFEPKSTRICIACDKYMFTSTNVSSCFYANRELSSSEWLKSQERQRAQTVSLMLAASRGLRTWLSISKFARMPTFVTSSATGFWIHISITILDKLRLDWR